MSSAVVKTSDLRVGIVVLRSMSFVKTPPFVLIPSESGVTSSRRTSLTSPFRTPAWIAAPTATTSSGLTPLCGSLPMSSLTFSWTAGMRVMPPTRTTWSMSAAVSPASDERLLRRLDGALEQAVRELVELRPRELEVEVLRALRRRGDERQVDLRRHRRGELDLGLLARLVQTLERHRVLTEVDALVALELGDHPVDDRLVEVVAAEVVVAVRRLHLEDAVAEVEHGDVERAAAEVEDEDRLLGAFLVEPVRERRGGRLVDDPKDVEAGDLAGILRRLALRVVEVRRDGDDRVRDGLAEVRLGVLAQLLEDHRRDLRRRVARLLVRLYADVAVRPLDDLVGDDLHLLGDLVELAAHEPLDREDRVLGVRDLLALRRRADEPLAVTPEGDDGRCRASALGVRDDGGLGALEHGHAGVGRAEVDSDGLRHGWCSFRILSPSYVKI